MLMACCGPHWRRWINPFSFRFPFGDEARLDELAEGFCVHSGGILDGCVLAMDGFGVATRAPFKSEVEAPKDYRF